MSTEVVADPQDERLADYLDLRHRPERGTVIVEGIVGLAAVPGSGHRLRSVLCLPNKVDRVINVVGPEADVLVADRTIVQATVGFDLHRGVVASVERPAPRPWREVVAGERRVAVLEAISDTENLGSLFRNAAAFGVGAVLLDPTCADPLHRRTVRVALGHSLRVPFARIPGEDWPAAVGELAAAGFCVAALTPDPAAIPIDDVVGERPDKVAFLLGGEGHGLSERALAAAGAGVRIPMAPGVDSLNVATAAAIAFHRFHVEMGSHDDLDDGDQADRRQARDEEYPRPGQARGRRHE